MKRLKRKLYTLLIVVILAYALQYADNIDFFSNIYEEDTHNDYTNVTSNNFTKAHVSRVIDGDTIEVVLDSQKYKVRLIGINCPEYTSKVEYFGKESAEFATNELTSKDIYLEKDVSNTDKYGRLLRYVWLEIPIAVNFDEIKDKMFNAVLLDNGYAMQATYPPDVKYSDMFKDISTDARINSRGLW